jgi:NhaA family Na+:H+ antiporter
MDQLIVTVGDAVKENRPMTNDQRKEVLAMLEKTSRESGSLQGRLNTHLQPWVNFVIMPLFALANAGVVIEPSAVSLVTLSVAMGLVVGKPLGIFLVSFLAIKAKICMLPTGVNWKILLGGGMLAGIGFTMSLFVAGLAFGDPAHGTFLAGAKVGILTGSFVSAILGILFMKLVSKPTNAPEESSADAVEPA